MAGLILAGWMMIEVFDTAAAGIALARRKLGCPDCGKPLRPWRHARERTVRDLHGTSVTTRPDRALCPACQVTHVVLDAALLPRRAYAARLIGQALVAAVQGSGHRRIALDLDVLNLHDRLATGGLASVVAAMVRGGGPDSAVRWALDMGRGGSERIALAKALAETGDLDRAEWFVHMIDSQSGKVEVLTALMESANSTGAAERFWEFAGYAESVARSTTDPVKQALCLLDCAEALARTCNTHAAERLIHEVNSIARSVDDQRMNRPILRALVRSLLEIGAYDRAAAVVLSINDSAYQMEASTLVINKSGLQASRRLLASLLVLADPIPYLNLLAKVEPCAIREAVSYLPHMAFANDVSELSGQPMIVSEGSVLISNLANSFGRRCGALPALLVSAPWALPHPDLQRGSR